MDIEANRHAAVTIVEAVASGRFDRAAFTDDAIWWMQGSGELPIDAFAEMAAAFSARHVAGPGEALIHGVTAEGDRVAVEAECIVPLANGSIYRNSYHFLILFRDGKARLVKEYHDTERAADAFRRG
ncbi:nuclear transport factor 2 family protein [Sphingomonas naphthae]|uniref:Nuclear transport factor 2 family protein n=1 Tax=Sphingomonas naphthae TaxID=1813468 RepID=A0ABY7TM87_9SPHN|nr:nuclear transport factor 2 family protein [Sphingomonas naphthae]WCT73871.1 nuclear transport factor 2 family protein [Sphingomonas naphthae]